MQVKKVVEQHRSEVPKEKRQLLIGKLMGKYDMQTSNGKN